MAAQHNFRRLVELHAMPLVMVVRHLLLVEQVTNWGIAVHAAPLHAGKKQITETDFYTK